MAIIIKAAKPTELLQIMKTAIDSKKVETWSYDSDGDFTHTPDQWKNKAWLKPSIVTGELHFGILGQKDITVTKLIYGVYHGRFIEMILTHFDANFETVYASAKGTSLVLC